MVKYRVPILTDSAAQAEIEGAIGRQMQTDAVDGDLNGLAARFRAAKDVSAKRSIVVKRAKRLHFVKRPVSLASDRKMG